jgi:hypothetical protein
MEISIYMIRGIGVEVENFKIYIGSTISSLNKRLNSHKYTYLNKKKLISVNEIFDKYGVENCEIIPIKKYQVCDERHGRAYEQLTINKFLLNGVSVVNHNYTFGIKVVLDKYILKNNFIKRQEFRLNSSPQNLIKHNHYIKNKDTYIERAKRRYNEKKNSINQMRKESKIYCDKCNITMRKTSLNRHKISKLHLSSL